MPSSPPEPWDRLRRSMQGHELERSADPGFDRYEMRDELGRGGVAVVYRAWDRQLEREVAIKVLRSDMKLGSAASRLRREAQVTAKLSHPNLVSVYDAGEKDGQIYLVMELVAGQTLAELLLVSRLDLDMKVAIVEKVARAVAVAHANGVIHRDLKPGNILMSAAGEPKVGDFGLAHLVGSETRLTHTGAALGTPMYMAPEQVLGRNDEITERTDVHALGAILYEMIAGTPPFAGTTSAEIYRKIVEDDPGFPGRRFGIPGDLETIALKALQKSPLKRYPSATAFADDLARYRAHEPIQAKPIGLLSRLMHRGYKHRRILIPTTLAAAVTLLFAATWIRSTLATRERVRESLLLAVAHRGKGELDKALSEYRLAAELSPGDREAREGVEAVLTDLARREHDRAEALNLLEKARPVVDKAVQSYYRADVDTSALLERVKAEAMPLIRQAIAKAPSLPNAHHLLGCALDLLGSDSEAEAAWRKAVEIDPAFGAAHFQLGRILINRVPFAINHPGGPDKVQGTAEEVVEHFKAAMRTGSGLDDQIQREVAKAIVPYADSVKVRGEYGRLGQERFDIKFKTDPASADRRDELSRLMHGKEEQITGLQQETAAICRKAVATFGPVEGTETLYWLIGITSSGPKELQALDEALQICPKFVWGLLARGHYHHASKGFERAIEDYTLAIRVRPDFEPGLKSRGDAYYQLGDYSRAIEDFRECTRILPDDFGGYFNLGNTQIAAGDHDGAVDTLTRCVALAPGDGASLYYLGRAHFAKGDHARAAEDCARCVELAPNYTDAYLILGQCHEKLGRAGEAAKAYAGFLRTMPSPDWPNGDWVRQALKRLEQARDF